MKTKKLAAKLASLIMTGMIVTAVQTIPVSAATAVTIPPNTSEFYVIMPRWASTSVVAPSISKSGRSISASVLISPKNKNIKSSGTLYLERYSGGSWKTVTSWSINKTGTVDITKLYRGKSNEKYRTKVSVTTGEDKITVTSNEITID